MKKLFAVTAVLCAALLAIGLGEPAQAAAGDWTEEVLVLNSAAVELPVRHPTRAGALIQNGGPNSIFCATGAQADAGDGAVLDKSVEVTTGGSLWVRGAPRIFCKAKTADQVTGAATRQMEVP